MAAPKSPKPSGLTIKRDNRKFTFSWKIPSSKYAAGQYLQYFVSGGAWTTLSVGSTSTSKSVTLNYSNFWPNKIKVKTKVGNKTKTVTKVGPKLASVRFRIKGQRTTSYSYSDYETKIFNVEAPLKPSISVTDGETYPSANFKWEVKTANNDKYIYSKVEYQTVLVKDSPSDGSKITKGWSKVTTKTSNSANFFITEDSSVISQGSYRRWFRIRSLGPGGTRGWVYASRVYATPYTATILDKPKPSVSLDSGKKSYTVKFNYKTPYDAKHPVSKAIIQYSFAIPRWNSTIEQLVCPNDADWTTKVEYAIKDSTGGIAFKTDRILKKDECLWARVNLTYRDKETQMSYGVPYLLKKGTLAIPSELQVQVDNTTHRASITVNNESEAEDSFLIVRYYSPDKKQEKDVGFIKNGSSSTIVQCPDWGSGTPSFGVYAAIGTKKVSSSDEVYIASSDTTVVSGKTYYELVGEGTREDPKNYIEADSSGVFQDSYTNEIDETEGEIELSRTPTSGTAVLYNVYAYNTDEGATQEFIATSSFRAGTELTNTVTVPGNRTITIVYDGNKTFEHTLSEESDNYSYEFIIEYTSSINPSSDEWYEIPSNKVIYYNVASAISSDMRLYGGKIPSAPKPIATATSIPGTIRVSWDWSWNEADYAELSWADHEDAWESTDEPQTYIVSKLKASSWNISGLETGIIWYVRVRLLRETEDGTTYGAYSETASVNLSSAPLTPELILSKDVATIEDQVTASWVYSGTDGTGQASAVLSEVLLDNGEIIYNKIASVQTAQYVTFNIEDLGWGIGETHYLAVQVTSASGLTSDSWSNQASVTIAEPITCEVINSSLEMVEQSSTDEEGNPFTWQENSLTSLPLTFSIIKKYKETQDETVVSVINYEYVQTSDTEVEEGKEYYIRVGEGTDDDPYTYETVDEPSGNPALQGLYEQTAVSETKDYYSRSGEGTDDDPYVYTIVNNPTGDPKQQGWYEIEDLEDNTVIIAVIERSESYHVDRPDETEFNGFDGESIAIVMPRAGDKDISIGYDDLIGNLDDGAGYNLIVSVQDSLGQAFDRTVGFHVHWSHQAEIPTATAVIDDEQEIAILNPIAPTSLNNVLHYESISEFPVSGNTSKIYISDDTGKLYNWDGTAYIENTDVCDIYRLSVDKPELIYEGATFGVSYVDPYPTIGEYGGHRFVTRTLNGDYITADNTFAWIDTDDIFNTHTNIINFDDGVASVLYEVDISNAWAKDFKETKYLGGSVQGDWNKAISRTGTLDGTAVSDYDQELIQKMRRLAAYPGLCHVRTKDGSNYTADIQVSETFEYTRGPRLNKYNLSITRVDNEELDGVTLEEWNNTH